MENQNKLLDKILTELRNYDRDSTTKIMEIHLQAKAWNIKEDVLRALYQILVEDKYLNSDYKITARGILFNENEGYEKNAIILSFENRRIERLEKNTFRVVSLAAISTTILVIIELYRIWHHLHWE